MGTPIRGDYEEGFQIAGEFGSVHARLPLTWYQKSGNVECFSIRDAMYRRPLGADAFTYKLQIESFADVILHGKPQIGANVYDGLASVQAMVAVARSVERAETVALTTVAGGL